MMKPLFGLFAVSGLLLAVACGGADGETVTTCVYSGAAADDGTTCNYCVDLLEGGGGDSWTTEDFDAWCAEAGGDVYTGNLCGESYSVATSFEAADPGIDVWAQNEACSSLLD